MKHLRRIFAAVATLAGAVLALAGAALAVLLDRVWAARKTHPATA